MAVGFSVIVRRAPTESGVPPRGVVNEEPTPGTNANVLWADTGRIAGPIPITELQRIFQFNEGAVMVGQWVQVTSFIAAGEGTPKNPACSGLVLDGFGLGDYDAQEAAENYIILSTEDGADMILVPFVAGLTCVQPSRRNV